MKIKPASEIREKYSRRAASAQDDYNKGVDDTSIDWQAATRAASSTYADGVNDAIQRGAFGKGVERSGNDKWRRKTNELGKPRWAPGVRAAAADYETGFAPIRDALERTTLPPRRPRGDPQNNERQAIASRAASEARKR